MVLRDNPANSLVPIPLEQNIVPLDELEEPNNVDNGA